VMCGTSRGRADRQAASATRRFRQGMLLAQIESMIEKQIGIPGAYPGMP
jgi:hypothetical protein